MPTPDEDPLPSGPRPSRLDEFIAHPRRAVWVVAAPMIAGFSAHSLYLVVDTMFIGWLGPHALAAATFVGVLFFFAVALIFGLATGVTACIAQAIGRRDHEGAERIAANGLSFGMLLGVAFAAIGLIYGHDMIPLLGAEGESIEQAWQYLQPISFALPIFFASAAIRAVLTGEGDAKTPMVVLAIATVINTGLDPLFMFTFGWGIRGAALATLAAQLFSLFAFVYVAFVRKRMHTRFHLRFLFPSRRLLWTITVIGFPAAAAQLVMSVGSGLINRVLAEFGQAAVAGYGAASRVDMIVALPVMGLAGATVTVIGMFAGAGRADLVRHVSLYSYRWAVSIAAVVGMLAFAGSEHVIGLFTKDAYALEVGRGYLTYMVFMYPLMAFGMTTGRALQGLGYGIPALLITMLRVLLIAIPGSYLAVYVFDAPIETIWLCFLLGGLASTTLSIHWIRKYMWLRDPTLRARQEVPSASQ